MAESNPTSTDKLLQAMSATNSAPTDNSDNVETTQEDHATEEVQATDRQDGKGNIPVIHVSVPKPRIELEAEFQSFLELREAIEMYQREKSVQLIVKDSKLLEAESTRRVSLQLIYELFI